MKKIFLPLHIWYIFYTLLFMFIIGCGVYMVVIGIYILFTNVEFQSFILIFGGLYLIYLFGSATFNILHNKIILTDNKIIVTGPPTDKKDGLQFSDEIGYDEIQGVALIYANANSKKKRIKNAGYSSLRPFLYYEVTLKNDETKWIYIECFSKKQRKEILNTINDKTGLNLSYKQLERKDYSIYKRKNSK